MGHVRGLGTGALAALGAAEEVIFRAYFFRLLSMATGTWIAVLVSSALFGAVHAANPGANLFSSLAIALEAGVILAGAYAVTGRLWVPIGLHAGWNFAEVHCLECRSPVDRRARCSAMERSGDPQF